MAFALCVIASGEASAKEMRKSTGTAVVVNNVSFKLEKPQKNPRIAGKSGKLALIECHKLAERAATTAGLSQIHPDMPLVFLGILIAESGCDPTAISSKGARGIAQLMPQTALEMGVRNPRDPLENATAGARYFRQQYEEFGSLRLALSAYNAGPSTVRKWSKTPPYRETQLYVQRVSRVYLALKNLQERSVKSHLIAYRRLKNDPQ